MHADLQRLLAADLMVNLHAKPIERLRNVRVEMSGAEGDISFARRVTQGRLDIVGHEVERRARGGADGRVAADQVDGVAMAAEVSAKTMATADAVAGSGDEGADASSLLFEIPEIMTDGPAPGAARQARSVAVMEPGPVAMALVHELNEAASPSTLSGVEDVDQATLVDLFDALREMEIELSSIRRQLHDRIDLIQDEIARRYRDGEASVDSLLR